MSWRACFLARSVCGERRPQQRIIHAATIRTVRVTNVTSSRVTPAYERPSASLFSLRVSSFRLLSLPGSDCVPSANTNSDSPETTDTYCESLSDVPLTAGTRIGPYQILAAIGAGGMGEKLPHRRSEARPAGRAEVPAPLAVVGSRAARAFLRRGADHAPARAPEHLPRVRHRRRD